MSEINLCHTTKIKRSNERIGKRRRNEGINRRKGGCSMMNNFEPVTSGNTWVRHAGAQRVAAFLSLLTQKSKDGGGIFGSGKGADSGPAIA
jgi:hypothetical protein